MNKFSPFSSLMIFRSRLLGQEGDAHDPELQPAGRIRGRSVAACRNESDWNENDLNPLRWLKLFFFLAQVSTTILCAWVKRAIDASLRTSSRYDIGLALAFSRKGDIASKLPLTCFPHFDLSSPVGLRLSS